MRMIKQMWINLNKFYKKDCFVIIQLIIYENK